MATTTTPADLAGLPPVPRNPLPYRQRLNAIKAIHTGQEVVRDAGGPVTRLKLAPQLAGAGGRARHLTASRP